MRTTSDPDAEEIVLTTEPGRALLAEVSAVAAPGPADLSRWRKSFSAEVVSAAVRLAACRRRAAAKFDRHDAMWLEATGLEQATSEPVARHKATRFAGGIGPVIDLCCGIGGDALALAGVADVVAVDLDEGMIRRTRWNARVYGVGERVLAVRARAERFPIPAGARVHIDPDRRAGGARRAKALGGYAPGLEILKRLPTLAAGGAIKLGPASDFADHFGGPGFEVEIVSLAGECKEATVWFGDLASSRRRATSLPSGAIWTDRDGPSGAFVGTSPARGWVFDPDPALGRAGLLDPFAAAHGLTRVASGIDVLTGPEAVESPWLTPFAVEATLPLDLRRIRRLVASSGVGPLVVKTRGLDLRPEELRRRLRGEGGRTATLFLLGGPGTAVAILAHRVQPIACLDRSRVAD